MLLLILYRVLLMFFMLLLILYMLLIERVAHQFVEGKGGYMAYTL